MFNSIVEFIQSSVTAIVTLTVGALGIGGNNVLDTQTANIADATLSVVEEEVTNPIVSNDTVVGSSEGETEYFEKTDVAPATFVRPVSDDVVVVDNTTQAEVTRLVNPVKSNKKAKTIDVSSLLQINFDEFDPNLKITKITEDDFNYYCDYKFKSLVIREYVWKVADKEKQISVSKTVLGDQDLEDYLLEELGEVIENEIVFLKEVQVIQKTKLAKTNSQIATIASSLVGKVLDVSSQVVEYTPDVTEVVVDEEIETVEPVVEDITTSADNEAPLIIIHGNNPALIQIGASYLDLGVKVTDNISSNLGAVTGGDIVDTSIKGSYFITYTATDEAGNVATATREVIVYDYGVIPVVEVVVEEEEEEVVLEVIVEEEVVEEEEIPDVIEPVVEEEEEEVVPEVVLEIVVEEEVVEEEEVPVVTEPVAEGEQEEVVPEEVVVEEVPLTKAEKKAARNTARKAAKALKAVADAAAIAASETVEVVVEVVGDTIETVAEVTSETIENISEGVEVVAEELSAMMKAINLFEILGNIRSALQASVSTAGEGTSNSLDYIGHFFKNVAGGIADIFGRGFSIISKSTHNDNAANVSGYKNVGITEDAPAPIPVSFNNYELENQTTYKKESFIGFAFKKVVAVPGKLVDGVVGLSNSITATIKNYGKVVSSDLGVVGGQIDQKIDDLNLNPKGIVQITSEAITGAVSNVLNFFKNHQPF